MVWHSRPVRRGGNASLWGLVLTEPCEEFFSLVAHLSTPKPIAKVTSQPPRRPPVSQKPRSKPKQESKGELAPAPTIDSLRQYAVRVTQTMGSRTCRIVVAAESEKGAAETALAEAGEGWAVLEVTAI